MKFHRRFREYVERQLPVLSLPDVNILRLGDWGEVYVTSREGARRIVIRIERVGILQNIDNQLRERCGVEARPIGRREWSLQKATNRGDCTKSLGITPSEAEVLRTLNKKSTNQVPPRFKSGSFDHGYSFPGSFTYTFSL